MKSKATADRSDPIKRAAESAEKAWLAEEASQTQARIAEYEKSIQEVSEAVAAWGDTPLPKREELVDALVDLDGEIEEFREAPAETEFSPGAFDDVLKWVGRPRDVKGYLDATRDTSFELLEMRSHRHPFMKALLDAEILETHPLTRDVVSKRKQDYCARKRAELFAIPDDPSSVRMFIGWGFREDAVELGCVDEWDRREQALLEEISREQAAEKSKAEEKKRIREQLKPDLLLAIFNCLGPSSEHWETMKLAQAEGLLHKEDVIELLWKAVYGHHAPFAQHGKWPPGPPAQHVSPEHPDFPVFGSDPAATITAVDQISVVAYQKLKDLRPSIAEPLESASQYDLAGCVPATGLRGLCMRTAVAAGNARVAIERPFEIDWRYERVTSNNEAASHRTATTAVCRVTLGRCIVVEARFVLELR